MSRIVYFLALLFTLTFSVNAAAALMGFADVVLDYFDSGAGPLVGPYGGTLTSFPVLVSTDVVLGDDSGGTLDFLSLPTGSFVTVGFTDETVIDGVGDDLFIQETGAGGETAEIFVSANLIDFLSIGIANDSTTTAFDLASIGFTGAVQAVKIVGLDNFGGSPGFDVVNVQVLPGSIGAAPSLTSVPEPSTIALLGLAVAGVFFSRKEKKA